jgi:hypothetical protein
LENFYTFASKIMVWVLYHRRRRNNPNLKSIKIKNFIEITPEFNLQQAIPDSKLINTLDSRGNVKTEQSWEYEQNGISQEIKGINPKNLIRGKFEIEFFVEFIQKSREELNKSPEKPTVHFNITSETALGLLGPRVKCPPCLDSYLKSKLNLN